jgi:hypothetical protein
MDTRTIPPDQWATFFDQFSRLHQGKPVRVQSLGRDEGVQATVREAPLLGITQECRGGTAADARKIWIMTGDPSGAHASHAIERPSCVRVAEWNDGYSAALDITSADGSAVLLEAGPPQQLLAPGLVTDGTMFGEQLQ